MIAEALRLFSSPNHECPNSNEAIAILIEESHVKNMLTRMVCGRYRRGMLCKVRHYFAKWIIPLN